MSALESLNHISNPSQKSHAVLTLCGSHPATPHIALRRHWIGSKELFLNKLPIWTLSAQGGEFPFSRVLSWKRWCVCRHQLGSKNNRLSWKTRFSRTSSAGGIQRPRFPVGLQDRDWFQRDEHGPLPQQRPKPPALLFCLRLLSRQEFPVFPSIPRVSAMLSVVPHMRVIRDENKGVGCGFDANPIRKTPKSRLQEQVICIMPKFSKIEQAPPPPFILPNSKYVGNK